MPGEKWTDYIHEDVLTRGSEQPELMGEIKEITDVDLLKAIDILKAEYGRQMKNTIINVGDPKVDRALAGTFSIFGPEEHMGLRPRVAISERLESLTAEDVEQERKNRAISFEIVDDALKNAIGGKPLETRLYKLFFFLHDVGHAMDYWDNYKTNFLVSYKSAYEKRLKNQNKERESLPIPNVAIGFIRKKWSETKNVEGFVSQLRGYYGKHYPGFTFDESAFRRNLKSYGSMEELIDEHEKQEKRICSEQFADNFAIEFLKRHWQELSTQEK